VSERQRKWKGGSFFLQRRPRQRPASHLDECWPQVRRQLTALASSQNGQSRNSRRKRRARCLKARQIDTYKWTCLRRSALESRTDACTTHQRTHFGSCPRDIMVTPEMVVVNSRRPGNWQPCLRLCVARPLVSWRAKRQNRQSGAGGEPNLLLCLFQASGQRASGRQILQPRQVDEARRGRCYGCLSSVGVLSLSWPVERFAATKTAALWGFFGPHRARPASCAIISAGNH